jgi:glycosyltransferase involved in cell wall biosynthesis
LFSDEANESFRNQLKIEKHDFVFIFVGRLVADKGINELISAFTKLSKEVLNCKLLLVGPFEQDLNPITETNVNEIKNNPKIINVGYKDDVRPYFAIANCLVFPSHREGFPNVVLQAGAMNLPSIVSDINGCNEIIIHNENGLIIPFKNELAIFDAMKLILEDEELYNKLRISSRDAIVSRFEQHIVWKAILTEYTILEQNV